MKKFTPLTPFLLVLMLMAFSVQAQNNKKLIFDTGGQTDIQGNATININTGDITVQPVGNKLIVDEPASQKAIIGFYPSQYAINPGDTIGVNWAVAFTDNTNCIASVENGSATWLGNKNAQPGVYVQPNVTVTQLPATLRLTCNDYNGGSSYQEFDLVKATNGNGGTMTNPVIDTFQLVNFPGQTNLTIPTSSYAIEWSVSNLTNTVSGCSASSTALNNGGWDGTRGDSGSETIYIDGSPTLRLTCSNSGGTPVQKSISITNSGSGGGGNPSCANALKPPGLSPVVYNWMHQRTTGMGNYAAIPGTHGFGFEFGSPENVGYSMVNQINPESSYIVVEGMPVPSHNVDRFFNFGSAPGFGANGVSTMSISTCAGDFDPTTTQCVVNFGTFGNIRISNRPEVNQIYKDKDNFCYVEKNKNYYVNFVFAPTYDGVVKNGILEGEECDAAVGNKCSIFWGEDVWVPYIP